MLKEERGKNDKDGGAGGGGGGGGVGRGERWGGGVVKGGRQRQWQ